MKEDTNKTKEALNTEPMKIKAILPYFGGKRSLAPTIVKLMGKHRVYWEPFCGSMAVLMAKPPCKMETVNDLHGDLINLARVIQHRALGEKLYDKLARTLCAEQFFREAKERWISSKAPYTEKADIDRAYNYFVASWMGLNGVSGTARCNYQFALRWSIGGGQGAKRWASVVDSVPAWHKRLRNVLIINRDALKVIEEIKDDTGVVIYCDPPYIDVGTRYIHDMADNGHKELVSKLNKFKKTRVIVSYYDHPKLTELYKKWGKTTLPKKQSGLPNATKGIMKKQRNPPAEVLLTNWTPETEKRLF